MIRLTQSDLPKISDTLSVDGVVVDLTSTTVQFVFQGAGVSYTRTAAVTSPATAGKVEYQFVSGETNAVGLYLGQWLVTRSGVVTHFPTDAFQFEIVGALPVPTDATSLPDCYDFVRALVGDFNSTYKRYDDSSILSVLRTVVRLGKLSGYTLSPDRNSITPALAQARDWGVLLYNAALMLIAPNAAAYAYTRRELSERFGDQGLFLAQLNEVLFDFENPDCFASTQSLASFLNGMTGVNIYAQGTALTVNAPYESATISRSGITVSGGV